MAARTHRIKTSPRAFLAGIIAVGVLLAGGGQARATTVRELALPAWTGGVELYRSGVFTTQRSWLWCTAAGVQIAHNIAENERDHTTGGQRRYFEWMRERNRYDLPISAGVDPEGWEAGLRHFVDDRYRLVASRTFDAGLRSAVQRMRMTNLPVALTVSHGNHGWILAGFRATADPASTDDYEVTTVRVIGPLYGLQSKGGYDMRPNTELTTAQLRKYFTPWHYEPKKMVWDGRYVSIQPVPVPAAAAAPTSRHRTPSTPEPTLDSTILPAAAPSATAPAVPTLPPLAAVRPEIHAAPSSLPGDGYRAVAVAVDTTGQLWLIVSLAAFAVLAAVAFGPLRRGRGG